MSKYKNLMLGAFAGTLIASAFAIISGRPDLIKKVRNQTKDLAEKAMSIKDHVFEDLLERTESRKSHGRRFFARGTVLGLLLGVGSAALLTPKTGKQLRKNLTDSYQELADKTNEIAHTVNGYRRPVRKMANVIAQAAHFSVKKKSKSRPKARAKSSHR